MSNSTLRTCPKGHQYYKSSDCPTCPTCESFKKPQSGFLSTLSAPAFRALESIGVDSIETLAQHSEKELLQLHGFGKASLPKLRAALAQANLTFKA